MKQCIVIVPMYKNVLEWYEKLSFNRLINILNEYPICLCVPESLDVSCMDIKTSISFKIERFDNKYFTNIDGYNKLMLSKSFYQRFSNYKYMLIYQLDALVFLNKLQYFINLGYDYIGAPWFGAYKAKYGLIKSNVGNGGLSLRNIFGAIRLLERYPQEARGWEMAEDVFFSIFGKKNPKIFKLAPFSVAVSFAFERMANRCYKFNKCKLPFGCHKWMFFSRDFYLDKFKELNISVGEYDKYMRFEDEMDGRMALNQVLLERFVNQNNKKKYINNKKEVSIYGFGNHGRIVYDILMNCGIKIVNIYDERKLKYGDGEYTKKSNEFIKEYNGELVVVTSSKYEVEIMKFLMKNKLMKGKDFISIYEQVYRSIFPAISK